ncbi:hypothetical protein DPMN_024124 [Dreissena polymorpha]|uniref:Uncharacterized protein n=1 Tax=Dreissena polymorpha TaxID=45954 RepID=A0A9D4RC06_DREPO|nr:hypothetical protein DPMN_024124 [Dreissena polymorpha]
MTSSYIKGLKVQKLSLSKEQTPDKSAFNLETLKYQPVLRQSKTCPELDINSTAPGGFLSDQNYAPIRAVIKRFASVGANVFMKNQHKYYQKWARNTAQDVNVERHSASTEKPKEHIRMQRESSNGSKYNARKKNTTKACRKTQSITKLKRKSKVKTNIVAENVFDSQASNVCKTYGTRSDVNKNLNMSDRENAVEYVDCRTHVSANEVQNIFEDLDKQQNTHDSEDTNDSWDVSVFELERKMIDQLNQNPDSINGSLIVSDVKLESIKEQRIPNKAFFPSNTSTRSVHNKEHTHCKSPNNGHIHASGGRNIHKQRERVVLKSAKIVLANAVDRAAERVSEIMKPLAITNCDSVKMSKESARPIHFSKLNKSSTKLQVLTYKQKMSEWRKGNAYETFQHKRIVVREKVNNPAQLPVSHQQNLVPEHLAVDFDALRVAAHLSRLDRKLDSSRASPWYCTYRSPSLYSRRITYADNSCGFNTFVNGTSVSNLM